MRDALAERLLAAVMQWSPEQVAAHRPALQTFARYKYDEYQQFSPGLRFVESLALWLLQFKAGKERSDAFAFVRNRLLFFSNAEMSHFVSMAYPDFVRPILTSLAAKQLGVSPLKVGRVLNSNAFKLLRRQSLFLALSDGAHTDVFRRANPSINHEQVWHAYDMSPDKARSMSKKLVEALQVTLGREPTPDEAKFKFVCLLDDFSASGRSYLRWEERKDGDKTIKELGGKIARVIRSIRETGNTLHGIVDQQNCYVCVMLYVATEKALEHLKPLALELLGDSSLWSIEVVQRIPGPVTLARPGDSAFLDVVDGPYYDPAVEDDSTRLGGDTVRYGFADCALPLVLSHNTPNNSVFLLWGSQKIRGLFPRISRHHTPT